MGKCAAEEVWQAINDGRRSALVQVGGGGEVSGEGIGWGVGGNGRGSKVDSNAIKMIDSAS